MCSLVDKSIKFINPHIKNILRKNDINVVNSIINKFNKLIKLGKGPYTMGEKVNVVYKLACNGCNATYVGQTSQKLLKRRKEHESDCKHKRDRSAIYQHIQPVLKMYASRKLFM